MPEESFSAEDNFGLVHTCAKRFRGKGIEYDDLFQAGCLGLVKAAERFDESLGYRFSTYAVPVILGEIKKLFRDGGSLKVARSLKELSLRAVKEAQELLSQTGREPTVSELAERLGISPEQTAEALNAAQQPLSLTISDDDGDCQSDIPVDAPDEQITEELALRYELERLENRDRELIRLRYYKGLTQSVTAQRLGMTQVQVSRREKRLLLLLRERLSA